MKNVNHHNRNVKTTIFKTINEVNRFRMVFNSRIVAQFLITLPEFRYQSQCKQAKGHSARILKQRIQRIK